MIIGGWRGPGWRVFDAHPRLVRPIRAWVSSAVSGHGCPVNAADAALVVTELFGNAVQHGPAGGRVLVGYCLWRDGARLVVCDAGGPGTPRLVHGGEFAEGGRGLHVVDSLAARWGSFRLASAQAVWCDFGQPLHAAASDAWAWLHLVLSVCDLSASDNPVPAVMPGRLTAVGDELRQVRAAARNACLAGLRAAAEAHAAQQHGNQLQAARYRELAGSYQALHQAYQQREDVFAATMADRADWDKVTRQQRHLAVAADAELRRRHPELHYPPLRSAEPEPATQAQRDELTLSPGQPIPQPGQWIKDLTAAHRTFAGTLAERQSLTIPPEDPGYGDLGQAFPPWPGPAKDAILQPPKPEIRPSPQILQRAADRDADREAAD